MGRVDLDGAAWRPDRAARSTSSTPTPEDSAAARISGSRAGRLAAPRALPHPRLRPGAMTLQALRETRRRASSPSSAAGTRENRHCQRDHGRTWSRWPSVAARGFRGVCSLSRSAQQFFDAGLLEEGRPAPCRGIGEGGRAGGREEAGPVPPEAADWRPAGRAAAILSGHGDRHLQVKAGLAEMLKGGVIMDVVTPDRRRSPRTPVPPR